MSDPLLPARRAAESRDWSSVNESLQKVAIADLPAAEVLPLTLQVLEYGDFQQRWDAVKVVQKLGEIAIAPLIEILADEEADIELRWFAGGVLADFHHPQAIASLVNIAETSTEPELTEMAIATLGKIGTPAIDAISELLLKPDRLVAVRTLAQIHLSQTVTPLLSVVKDPQPEIRQIAISALSNFRDPQITGILIDSLADIKPEVRKAAVIGLGLRQEALVAQIEPLLRDIDLDACVASAIALGRIKTDTAATALFNRFQEGEAALELQLAIVRAIAWIETPTALEYLQQLLNVTPLPLSQEIINRLGGFTEPSLQAIACQILLSFAANNSSKVDNPQIWQSLATALGELRQVDATDTLIQLLGHSDESVRLHAIAALKRISPDLSRRKLQQMAEASHLTPELKAGVAIALQEW